MIEAPIPPRRTVEIERVLKWVITPGEEDSIEVWEEEVVVSPSEG